VEAYVLSPCELVYPHGVWTRFSEEAVEEAGLRAVLPALYGCLYPVGYRDGYRAFPVGVEDDLRVVVGKVPSADSAVRSCFSVPLLPDDHVSVDRSPRFDESYRSWEGALDVPEEQVGVGLVGRFECLSEFFIGQGWVRSATGSVRPRWVAGDDREAVAPVVPWDALSGWCGAPVLVRFRQSVDAECGGVCSVSIDVLSEQFQSLVELLNCI